MADPATFPINLPPANPAQVRISDATLAELKVRSLLLCRIANLLSIMAGPSNYTNPNGWTPEDLTAELDALRADAANAFN
jgi:hypothetical protein